MRMPIDLQYWSAICCVNCAPSAAKVVYVCCQVRPLTLSFTVGTNGPDGRPGMVDCQVPGCAGIGV
ncbi:Uncharacterised protein [Burkholderia gladioli]|nr:Uncharacterised protein [Burkholderia gladioli]